MVSFIWLVLGVAKLSGLSILRSRSSRLIFCGRAFLNQMRAVGRNESCPCGAGRKLKKCLGA
ncbi:SEC-C domain-containing protein [Pseudomonas cichorii]|nr:SEC-C domain-containing protein [Pseudomonas cichorii]